jgi:hypothetical protein
MAMSRIYLALIMAGPSPDYAGSEVIRRPLARCEQFHIHVKAHAILWPWYAPGFTNTRLGEMKESRQPVQATLYVPVD